MTPWQGLMHRLARGKGRDTMRGFAAPSGELLAGRLQKVLLQHRHGVHARDAAVHTALLGGVGRGRAAAALPRRMQGFQGP
jgi:hypothetical protein